MNTCLWCKEPIKGKKFCSRSHQTLHTNYSRSTSHFRPLSPQQQARWDKSHPVQNYRTARAQKRRVDATKTIS